MFIFIATTERAVIFRKRFFDVVYITRKTKRNKRRQTAPESRTNTGRRVFRTRFVVRSSNLFIFAIGRRKTNKKRGTVGSLTIFNCRGIPVLVPRPPLHPPRHTIGLTTVYRACLYREATGHRYPCGISARYDDENNVIINVFPTLLLSGCSRRRPWVLL